MKEFKKGDRVRMVNCEEAAFYEKKQINEWTCASDSFETDNGVIAINIEKYDGEFKCENLEAI